MSPAILRLNLCIMRSTLEGQCCYAQRWATKMTLPASVNILNQPDVENLKRCWPGAEVSLLTSVVTENDEEEGEALISVCLSFSLSFFLTSFIPLNVDELDDPFKTSLHLLPLVTRWRFTPVIKNHSHSSG